MNFRNGSRIPVCLFCAGLAICTTPVSNAQQDSGQVHLPSKYVYLENVELKPMQAFPYSKAQSDEIQAERAAKAPFHYVGMWGITGGDRVVYIHDFDSYGDLQKDHEATYAMPKLVDAMKANNAAQAASIAVERDSIYSFEKDLSLGAGVDLSKMRFMRMILFHVRSGHDEEFRHLVKVFVKSYQSSIPEAQWVVFQKEYGQGSDNTYLLATPMESLTVVDTMSGSGKKLQETIGEDQLATMRKGLDAAVESSETDLFAFDPSISYVPDSWLTSSPDFWNKK